MADVLQNDFSWSWSRHKRFQNCLRAYYWAYYGMWLGWDIDGEPSARRAYMLKNMTSLPAWGGDITHRAIELALKQMRSFRQLDPDRLKRWARARMNEEWIASERKQWKINPKYNCNLFEHYYDVPVSGEERSLFREKVFRCLDNFIASPPLVEARELGHMAWRTLEQLEEFWVDDIKVWIKIDFGYNRKDGTVALVDWKTGKRGENDASQLMLYALYAFKQWNLPLEQTRLALVYLDEGETIEWTPEPHDLIQLRETIFESAAAMRATLDDPAENEASIANYPLTERTYFCKSCEFRELCLEEGADLPPPRGAVVVCDS